MPGRVVYEIRLTTTSCHIHFNSLIILPMSIYCMNQSTLYPV
jgi:hypothetical protein